MANVIYPLVKKQMLQGGINLSSANIKVALIDLADYGYSAVHEFLSDVAGSSIVGTSGNLSGKVFGDDGSFFSNDPVASGVIGDQFEALIMYIDTGTPASSRLILYLDTGITGMPLTPDGSDVQITVDPAGWFVL